MPRHEVTEKAAMGPRRAAARGFALPVVLLLLGVLSLLALRLVERGREDMEAAQALAAEARARHAADAGYELFLAHHADPAQRRVPLTLTADLEAGDVTVTVTAETGKVDLNTGAPILIERLLRVSGVGTPDPAEAARRILAYRAPEAGGVFRAPEEAIAVAGLDPLAFGKVRAFLTVYGGHGGIDPVSAPREVLLAVPGMTPALAEAVLVAREAGTPPPLAAQALLAPLRALPRPVYTVRSVARMDDGSVFVREAIVDLETPGLPMLLAWRREVPPLPDAGGVAR
ncbi:helix-hairpin-helix domain-containing protein [Futiania mangrovi]|uniref:Helix-hairpin-helix domain-containing protein n=1 Tax=Futiania mangrovi TaxID=2959716 RepID=A0A9J6PCD9_9PROT|nr:helix-hairpin-helix domain-containing protein [Futiania mangrovii]MCP1337884.1 helix-hairpin-helix domain-containing protein [Futiania mangrovii]